MSNESNYISAQAHLHHAYLLGLQLMVSSHKAPNVVGDWMFRLFRRQHEEKFLSSFDKLGLKELPDAVACAQYHVLSNSIGGVQVEYMYEDDRKAWVRFRYPRWLYAGPTLCGVPVEVSRGFLQGWYAQNGVSLNNPRLGFVCVSEDMTGEFGFCGYFKEFDHELQADERLQFARDELPPLYIEEQQPQAPAAQWNAQRLQKANRNYAVEFVRNAIIALGDVLGEEETTELAGRAARLIGLQYFQDLRQRVGSDDGDVHSAATFLTRLFEGMGDRIERLPTGDETEIQLRHSDLKISKDLASRESDLVFGCWNQLWVGALASFRTMKKLDWEYSEAVIMWRIKDIST